MAAINIFQYAEGNNRIFKKIMAECGYNSFTTFFGDLSIGEYVGEKSIRETHRNVLQSWIENIKYITEYYMALNHKIWQMHAYLSKQSKPVIELNFERLMYLYNELWEDCYEKICKQYENDSKAMEYFYTTTD